jgi:hypothetical protein
MRRPLPTKVRSDLVARWIMERAGATLAEVMGRMVPIEGEDVHYTIRGDAPKPVFDITLHGGGPPTLVSGSLWIDPGTEILTTQIEDGRLNHPHLRLHAGIPATTRLAAKGRPLSALVDCASLGALGDARIASIQVDEEDDALEIMLEPQWITHDV